MTVSKVSLIKNVGGEMAAKAHPPQSAVVRVNPPAFQLAKALNRAKMQTKLTKVVE